MRNRDYEDPRPVNGSRMVDGVEVKTLIQGIEGLSMMTVEAGTTGFCGGDSGHGGRTYLRIADDGSTDMSAKITGTSCGNAGEVEIWFGGDDEMLNVIHLLEFAAETLRKQAFPKGMNVRVSLDELEDRISDVVSEYLGGRERDVDVEFAVEEGGRKYNISLSVECL